MFSQSLISPPSVPPNGGGASHWAALEHSLPRPKSCVGAALTDGERLTDGRTLGPDEGCWDGCELGTDEGCWDGEDEGVPLGILLGAELLLGSREGTLEGSKLGNAELSLGPDDGSSEGYNNITNCQRGRNTLLEKVSLAYLNKSKRKYIDLCDVEPN